MVPFRLVNIHMNKVRCFREVKLSDSCVPHWMIPYFLFSYFVSRLLVTSAEVFPCSQNGDGRPTGHICQHAWRVVIPSCCVISLRRRQQPEETGLKSGNLLEK